MTEKAAKTLRSGLSAGCALVTVAGGVLCGLLLLPEAPYVWGSLFAVCVAGLFVQMVVNLLVSAKYIGKFKEMTMRQIYDYGVELQRETDKDYAAAEKAARRSVRRADALLALDIVMCFLAVLFYGGMHRDTLVFPAIIALLVLCSLYGRAMVFFGAPEKKSLLSEREYPLVYAEVRRAAAAVGYAGKIGVELGSEGIGVRETSRGVVISINAVEVSLLTREELYTVMLHEFAHVVNVDTARGRAFALASGRYAGDEGVIFPWISEWLLRYCIVRVAMHVTLYRAFASRYHEALADRKVKETGNAQTYINATAKTAMYALYELRPFRALRYDCYAGEEAPHNLITLDLETFRAAKEKYGDRWKKTLAVELPARVASHPTLRQRMQAMNADEYDDETVEADEAYLAEQKSLLAFADRRNFEAILPLYKELRQDAYLSRKEQMEKYEKSIEEGEELPLDELVCSMQAYYVIDNEKALAVADRLLELDPDSAYAHFYRGRIFFDELDGRCVAEFRAAMRANPSMCDSCLERIGMFALLSGDEKLLEEYRAQAPENAQTAYDAEKNSVWKKDKPLRPTALPAEVLAGIAGRLGQMDDWMADCVYAADFGEESEPCTIIVVRFPRRMLLSLLARNMNDLSGYLDSRSEQFTLHTCGRAEEKALRAAGIRPFWEKK